MISCCGGRAGHNVSSRSCHICFFVMSFEGWDRGLGPFNSASLAEQQTSPPPAAQVSKQQAQIIKGNAPTHVTTGDYGNALNGPLEYPMRHNRTHSLVRACL